MILPPHRDNPIQEKRGSNDVPTDEMRGWMEEVSSQLNEGQNQALLTGTGTPEGSVEATTGQRYFDTAASAFYTKTTETGDTGWFIE